MTGMSCAFLLTKSSNLLLYYLSFFLRMYDYAILNSGYREASGYVGGFDPEDA
jgi:hypothetical protein